MQAKAAVHQACQHAHFGSAKDFAGKFGGTVGPREPAQVTALLAAGAVGPLSSRLRELGATIISTAQLDQQGFGPQTQLLHVHAWRDGKEHVAQMGAFALRMRSGMGLVVAAASL